MFHKIVMLAKRTTVLTAIAAVVSLNVQAQDVDSIYLHSGQVIGAKVIKVGETTLAFSYIDEDAQQSLGNMRYKKFCSARVKESR